MSLDVSRDGKTVVFDLLGQLHVMPISGGTAVALSAGADFNQQPRYSPDGRFISYISDASGSDNLWVMGADGTAPRMLSRLQGFGSNGALTSPEWSPDGRSIVVAQRAGAVQPVDSTTLEPSTWRLARYQLDNGEMQWIADSAVARSIDQLGPAFDIRTGALFAAVPAIRAKFGAARAPLERWRIARIEPATARIEPLLQGGGYNHMGLRPRPSPDGKLLAYVSSDDDLQFGIRLRHLDTGADDWLIRNGLDAPPLDVRIGECRDLAPGYAFTPDGKALIAAYGGKIHRIDLASGETTAIPFVARIERRMASRVMYRFRLPEQPVRTRSVRHPALSPDGRWIAFSVLSHIWIMELARDGHAAGPPRRLTADDIGEFYPSWTPDGASVVYSVWRDGAGGELRRASVTSKGTAGHGVSLTRDGGIYFHTLVSADGNRVFALRADSTHEHQLVYNHEVLKHLGEETLVPDGDPALVEVPIGGGEPGFITHIEGIAQFPEYPSPQLYMAKDPQRLHMGSTSWRIDGTDRRNEFAFTGPMALSESGGRVVVSPSGTRALVTRKYALFEVMLPRDDAVGELDLTELRTRALGDPRGAARRWGTALEPWVSWSRDGARVAFSQGGTLFVGNIKADDWTSFQRIDVPIDVPLDRPRGVLLLRNARIVTMKGSEVIERGDILVSDGRILAVGPAGTLRIPAGAMSLDVSGTTILPGYVDLHDHLKMPAGVLAQQSWSRLAKLALGVTATRDPSGLMADFAYQELERAGLFLGPRIFDTGLTQFGTDPTIRTLGDAREAVRPYWDYWNAETVKIYFDRFSSRRTWQLISLAASEAGLNATAHTNGVQAQITHAIDGVSGLEHAAWNPAIRTYDDVARFIALSGSTQTMTYAGVIDGAWKAVALSSAMPWESPIVKRFTPTWAWPGLHYGFATEGLDLPLKTDLHDLEPLVSSAARLVSDGGHVGVSAHGNGSPLGFHYEMWLYAVGGMPNFEILRAATRDGAYALGHLQDFGSLEPGKLADLQVVDRNPLENIRNTVSIRYVMKNGRLYDARDLTQLWPDRRSLPAIYLYD